MLMVLLSLKTPVIAQSLGLNNSSPDASSILDATAIDRGILIPRMTTVQRNAISSPAKSLLIFDTDQNMFYYNAGTPATTNWVPLLSVGAGWHGSQDRIKILPSDFVSNLDNIDKMSGYKDNGTYKGIAVGNSINELYAFIPIPAGFKATHVRIYGNSNDDVTVYESDITSGAISASKGNAVTGTEIDITDIESTGTNFIVVYINTDTSSDIIYGGYVTISPL